MEFKDKYHFKKEVNRRFAKQNLTKLVHTNSRFEGVNTTLAQTQTIIDGMGVEGVSVHDTDVIKLLQKAWNFVIKSDEPLTLDFEQKVNRIVAWDQALFPGEFRSGNGSVTLATGDEFIPDLVDLEKEQQYLTTLLSNPNRTATDKAITLMYHMMRSQLFWDGNKRTATLIANKIMIDNGAGLINVPLNKWGQWNELISDYYQSNDMTKIKAWTYEHAIQGITIDRNRIRMQPKPKKHNR